MKPALSDAELLAQMGEYEAAVDALLSIVEQDDASDEAFSQAAARLSEFGSLLARLEAGNLPADATFQAHLKSIRLKHTLLSTAALASKSEIGEALTKVREMRKQTGFYGATGSEVGVSCDMSG